MEWADKWNNDRPSTRTAELLNCSNTIKHSSENPTANIKLERIAYSGIGIEVKHSMMVIVVARSGIEHIEGRVWGGEHRVELPIHIDSLRHCRWLSRRLLILQKSINHK